MITWVISVILVVKFSDIVSNTGLIWLYDTASELICFFGYVHVCFMYTRMYILIFCSYSQYLYMDILEHFLNFLNFLPLLRFASNLGISKYFLAQISIVSSGITHREKGVRFQQVSQTEIPTSQP